MEGSVIRVEAVQGFSTDDMDRSRKFESHPKSAPGDFYVINGECIICGAPHLVAPDLIGWSANPGSIDPRYLHCIWKKQPETELEMVQAFNAFAACCVGCYRYAGNDPAVMERIGPEHCDHSSSTPRHDVPKRCG